MNTKAKRRMAVSAGIVVIVLVVVVEVVGGNSAAKTVSVAEAAELEGSNKIQVTGNVVENSFSIDGNTLTFSIYDAQADPQAATQLDVRYDGGVSATFGNDVTAICTGKKDGSGVLVCSELVTKCPSKYETATDALTVERLLGYDEAIVDKTVKVSGVIGEGGPFDVTSDVRFDLVDADNADYLVPVEYQGALSDEIVAGSPVVVQGSLNADGFFQCTQVSLEE